MNLIEVILSNEGKDICIKSGNMYPKKIEKYQVEFIEDKIRIFCKYGDEIYVVDSEITSLELDLKMISFEAKGEENTYQGFIKDNIGCIEMLY